MTSASLKAKIVRVKVEKGKAGLFYATSPDLKGLLVAEPTLDAFENSIPAAITDLYAVCGVPVVVTKADEAPDQRDTWIALHRELVKRTEDPQHAN